MELLIYIVNLVQTKIEQKLLYSGYNLHTTWKIPHLMCMSLANLR